MVEQLKRLLADLGARKLIIIATVTAIVIAGLIAFTFIANKPPMALLYSDLDSSSAQLIAEKLKTQKISFEVSKDGTSIMVPEEKLGELRLSLAGERLGGQLGYELLDKQDALGTTSFLQSINKARAIEGELARTIQSLEQVKSARVHLVLPEKQLFEKEEHKASASITLRTRGNLPASQVNAIRYLVSSAVPDLDPGKISIVDQKGTLLAKSDGNGLGDTANNLAEHQNSAEQKLRQQIETMLERIVGQGHVRAEVALELDANQIRQDADIYDPDKQVVARSTTVEHNDQNRNQDSGGEVTVGNNVPTPGSVSGTTTTQQAPPVSNGSQSASKENSEQVDYQNSKTHTVTVRESGTIKRISISVIVDGIYTNGSQGKMTYSSRSQNEIDQLKRLVESAVGFNAERGDTVEIANMRFIDSQTDKNDTIKNALPLGLSGADVTKLVQTSILALVSILALTFIIRPLLRFVTQNKDQNQSNFSLSGKSEDQLALLPPNKFELEQLMSKANSGDSDALLQLQNYRSEIDLPLENEIDVAQIEGRVKAAAIRKVGEVIERHPSEAASVIRQWMYE